MAQKQFFISYAWGGESEVVANEIQEILQQKGLELIRDKTDLGFKGLIGEFMERIGQGNLVILIISDKYLKSKHCMYELMEVEKRGEFYDRVFPIILSDANISESLGIVNYLKYWDLKIKELNLSVKELDNLADTRKVQEDINLYTDIRGAIDGLASQLGNMNTLTLEIMRAKNYQPLIDALIAKHVESPSVTPVNTAKKEGKVLYHIPDMMQVLKWTRCTVRLAWEEIFLQENLKIPEKEQVIESIRLGSVMQVSLQEGREGHNFEIRSINNEEQLILEDDYTQWLFDVKPLTHGNFTLLLRVTLIQIIEGKERKKDVVLERNVITEAVVPKALTRFETAEEGLIHPNISERDLQFTPKTEDSNSTMEPMEAETMAHTNAPSASLPSPRASYQTPPAASPSPEAPKAKSSPVIRRFMPYAASLLILVTAGLLIFNGGNMSSAPETAEDPGTIAENSGPENTDWEIGESVAAAPPDFDRSPIGRGNTPPQEEASTPNRTSSGNPGSRMILLTFNEKPASGSKVVMAFVATLRDWFTLEEINLPLIMEAYLIPDSTALRLNVKQEYTTEEIIDSLRKSYSRWENSDTNSTERTSARPKPLDTASLKRLQKIGEATRD